MAFEVQVVAIEAGRYLEAVVQDTEDERVELLACGRE